MLSKVLEKAIHSQLMDFLATKLLIDNIRQEVDKGILVGTTFIDLSKAFDTLSHGTLLSKLQAYGLKKQS